MKQPLALLFATVAIAGCGSDTPDGSATTATTTAATTTTTAATPTSARAKAVKFAACIRSHDVPDFPDPNAKNDFEYGVSVSAAVWKRATDACKSLQPPGTLSSKRTPKEQSTSLKFAACVRKNGVKDFPDPVNGEPLINTYKIPSSNQPGGMTILNAATAKCKSLMADAIAGK